MQLISSIKNEYFNNKIVPHLIYKTMCSTYNKCVRRRLLEGMDAYLLKEYKLIVEDVLNAIKGNILVTKRGSQCVVTIDSNAKINGVAISSLIRLIDYGNLEMKGVHLFDSSFEYVSRRINVFYGLYLMGGFNNVN